jgi:hypothetical protein
MAGSASQVGDLIQANFFQNLEGLNTTDSPFAVKSSQAVAGYNYDYYATGGITKRQGHTLLGSDSTQTNTQALALFNSALGSKTLLRAGNTKIQSVNLATGAVTAIADDAASPSTTVFSSTTNPVSSVQFNTASLSTTWFAGGGQASGILTGYNGTKLTQNGASTFAGSLTVADTGSGSSSLTTGTYWYAVAAYKASTGATSNLSLDTSVSVTSGHNVTIDLSGITSYDTTKYSQIWIYRSAVAGTTGFTTGDLVAKIAYNGSTYTVASGSGTIVSSTKYQDTGTYITTSSAVARASSTSLDNSTLQSVSGIGAISCVQMYRQRIVVASGSTLYFSEVNKAESWPTFNTINIPSAGNITALAVATYNTDNSPTPNYFLAVFKENELWIVSGTYFINLSNSGGVLTQSADISLTYIDQVGCPAQPLCTFANGFLFWLDYRGAYLWDGSGKPVYISRPIEYDFGISGDIDRSNLKLGCGTFYKKQNQVVWFLSSNTLGVQKLTLKLDLRLTLATLSDQLSGRVISGVFMKDSLSNPIYAATACFPTYDEKLYAGGNDNNIWVMFDNANSDNGTAIAFSYQTRPEDLGLTGVTKRFHKVIVWVKNSSTATLTLNYWVNYNLSSTQQASLAQQISVTSSSSLWDQATWDVSTWDNLISNYTPVVYNLANPTVSTEGDAITIKLTQSAVSTPLVIGGYSIIYSPLGIRK